MYTNEGNRLALLAAQNNTELTIWAASTMYTGFYIY